MALIPAQNDEIINDIVEVEQPSFTWKVNIDGNDGMDGSIAGYTEKVEALAQRIYLSLNTQRDKYKIYGESGYGVEKDDLLGMPIPYVIPEIDRRYRETIMRENPAEVTGVGNFAFYLDDADRGILTVQFTVSSIYGALDIENRVAL